MVYVELAVEGVMELLHALAMKALVELRCMVCVALAVSVVMSTQVMLPAVMQPEPKAEPSVV
jgi:hypothetical protein